MSGQPPLEGRESLVLRWMRSAPGRRQRRGALAPSGFASVAAHRVGLAGLVAWVAWYASLSVAEFPETAFAVLAPHVSRPMLYLLPIWSVVLGVVLLLAVRVCLMAVLSSLIAFRAHTSFLSMCRYLTALREPGDEDGGRSALIVMASLWLWPVWVFDGWGWFVTGGPPRR